MKPESKKIQKNPAYPWLTYQPIIQREHMVEWVSQLPNNFSLLQRTQLRSNICHPFARETSPWPGNQWPKNLFSSYLILSRNIHIYFERRRFKRDFFANQHTPKVWKCQLSMLNNSSHPLRMRSVSTTSSVLQKESIPRVIHREDHKDSWHQFHLLEPNSIQMIFTSVHHQRLFLLGRHPWIIFTLPTLINYRTLYWKLIDRQNITFAISWGAPYTCSLRQVSPSPHLLSPHSKQVSV